jgi:hypothetical protein
LSAAQLPNVLIGSYGLERGQVRKMDRTTLLDAIATAKAEANPAPRRGRPRKAASEPAA